MLASGLGMVCSLAVHACFCVRMCDRAASSLAVRAAARTHEMYILFSEDPPHAIFGILDLRKEKIFVNNCFAAFRGPVALRRARARERGLLTRDARRLPCISSRIHTLFVYSQQNPLHDQPCNGVRAYEVRTAPQEVLFFIPRGKRSKSCSRHVSPQVPDDQRVNCCDFFPLYEMSEFVSEDCKVCLRRRRCFFFIPREDNDRKVTPGTYVSTFMYRAISGPIVVICFQTKFRQLFPKSPVHHVGRRADVSGHEKYGSHPFIRPVVWIHSSPFLSRSHACLCFHRHSKGKTTWKV